MAPSIPLMYKLLASRTSGAEYDFIARDDVVVAAGPVELAVASSGERLVLVPVAADTPIMPDRKSAGVHLEKLSLVRSGQQREFLTLRCRRPHLNAMFEMVAEDLLKAFRSHPKDPVDAARRVLGLWRELLAADATRHPSPSTVRGLFGELWILRDLVQRGVKDAVLLWTGPTAGQQSVHDFFGSGNALEIKTISQRTELTVQVSSIEQLEPPIDGQLALSCLVVEELPADGEKVRDLVEDLRKLGVPSVPLLQRIHARGINFNYLSENDAPGFRLLSQYSWWVEDDFPRLTESTMAGIRPPEVTALTYRLDLTARIPTALDDQGWKTVIEALS